MLTTNYPSAGPALRFIMELMKLFPTSVDYVKSPEFFNRVLEVDYLYFDHLPLFFSNYWLTLKASKLGYTLASYASDPTFKPEQDIFFDEKLT